MASGPQNSNPTPGTGITKGKSNSGELLKTPSLSGDTRGNSEEKPERKVDFLLPPKVKGDLGSLGGFRIIKILGEGGMGLVFLAEDSSLNRKLAIKVILPTHANQTTKERFFREARATAALHHDNVIAIFQVGEDNGVPFLAMPFLQGQTLDKYLSEQKKLSVKEALRITMEGLAGLSSAHARNMVHRDIKPSNIWLEGGRKKVILLDFGLAKGGSVEDVSLTGVGAIMGTPAYMSPEQALANNVDRRSDLFSLGVVLYEMLTGEGPFQGKTVMAVLANLISKEPKPPWEVDPSIPQPVSDICMWMLAKDLDKRPNSARDVAARIQALDKGEDKAKSAAVVAKSEVMKTDSVVIKKTVEAPGNPKKIEEINPHYSSVQPRPHLRIKKKKKSSLMPIIVSMIGVFILIMGWLVYSLEISTRQHKNLEKQFVKEKKLNKEVFPEEGFVPLFPVDGNPEGWVNKIGNDIDKDNSSPDWLVESGELKSNSKSRGWLISKKEYADFILKFEIKLGEGADTGVLLRQPYPESGNQKFELQLRTPKADEKYNTHLQTGAIPGLFPTKNKVILGKEWNEVWIKFDGTHFDAKINGIVVQDLDLASIKEGGDNFKNLAKRPLKGHLGFQCVASSGEPIIFRKVQIKELNQNQSQNQPQTTQKPYEVVVANGLPRTDKLVELTRAKRPIEWEGYGKEELRKVSEKAFSQAPKIYLELGGYNDPIKAAEIGGEKGWVTGNFFKAKLHLIATRPDLLRKTIFYKDGVPVPNPF